MTHDVDDLDDRSSCTLGRISLPKSKRKLGPVLVSSVREEYERMEEEGKQRERRRSHSRQVRFFRTTSHER